MRILELGVHPKWTQGAHPFDELRDRFRVQVAQCRKSFQLRYKGGILDDKAISKW